MAVRTNHASETVADKYEKAINFLKELLQDETFVPIRQEDIQKEFHTAASFVFCLVKIGCLEKGKKIASGKNGNRVGPYRYKATPLLKHLTSEDVVNIERIRVDEDFQKQIKNVLMLRFDGKETPSVLTSTGRASHTITGRKPTKMYKRKVVIDVIDLTHLPNEAYTEPDKVIPAPVVRKVQSIQDLRDIITKIAVDQFLHGKDELAQKLRGIADEGAENELEVVKLIIDNISNQ